MDDKKKNEGLIGKVLVFIFLCIGVLFASWLWACGIVKLVTLILGLSFSWGTATVIWLVLLLLGTLI